jgi:hypothetical protein
MRRTLLGVLENEVEATQVLVELRSLGFVEDDLEVVKSVGGQEPPSVTTVYSNKKKDVGEKIADFFRSLGTPGTEDSARSDYRDDQAYYAEQLGRGRVVLIVRASDEESADRALKTLHQHGADNIAANAEPHRGGATIAAVSVKEHERDEEGGTRSLTASERTEGRARGVRVYDYSPSRSADLSEPREN